MNRSERVLNAQDPAGGGPDRAVILRSAGFDVVEAASNAETLQLLEQKAPDVAVLDAGLAGREDFVAAVKQRFPRILVLQISGPSPDGRPGGPSASADGFLGQPLEAQELLAAVRALFRIHAADERLRILTDDLEERVGARTRELSEANEKLRTELAERARVENALIQAQKMEAVGYLTGGIAHDFNNLLTAIIGGLDLIRRRVPDDKTKKLSENALQAAQRGARLTARLLAFSRSQTLLPKAVDAAEIILGMDDLLAQTLGPSISLDLRLNESAGPVMADPSQLELALLNLASNARDALSPAGGHVEIATRAWPVATAEPDLEPGDYVAVEMTDAGAGMPAEVAARAFDPFFTTKGAGQGTGLGLSQVYGVARQLGGTARIESTPGHGTTVRIILRRSPLVPEPHLAAQETEDGGETLLVVDDDDDVRGLIVAQLSDLGYRIVEASSGASALAEIERTEPKLALLDFSMPGMNGAELAGRLRALRPELPIVFTSGHADLDALGDALESAPLLRKPFRTHELASIVRATLERTGPGPAGKRKPGGARRASG